MSKESIAALIAAQNVLQTQIEALRAHEAEQARDRAMRAVSIKAKNLRPGDIVKWGYGMGQQEINGCVRHEGCVLLSTSMGLLWSLDREDRVKVYARA